MIKQVKKFHIRMMRDFILTMIALCVSAIGCHARNNITEDTTKIEADVYDQKRWMLEEWQSDSCGCRRIRNTILAELIIEKFDLKGKSKEQFLKCFGKPNEIHKGNLYYYIKAVCADEDKIRGDKTTIEFLFDKEDNLIGLSDYLRVE